MSATAQQYEVFRIRPEVGKWYSTAEYTRQTGDFRTKNERFFTSHTPRYVGKCIGTYSSGSGDGKETWSLFEDNGTVNRVDYSYAGRTSFVETVSRD
jgi:hypothetical protein